MQTPTLLVAALALGFAPAPPLRTERSAADLKKMQGTWVMTERRGGWFLTGRMVVGEPLIVIAGDRVRAMTGECVLTLDATRAPRRYVETAVGTAVALDCCGIYSLEGDSLKFSCNDLGERPPGAFDGPKRGSFVASYMRQKP